MPSFAQYVYYAAVVAWSASLYQFFLKDLMAVTLGLGRHVQAIEEFPGFECRRLVHERLEACEDLWLDDERRVLYAACAGTRGRLEWNAAWGKFNASGRRAGGSQLIALDIDSPGADGLFNMRAIKLTGYEGAWGDDTFDSVGFDAEIVNAETLRFFLVNHRPPVDDNNVIEAEHLGMNSTVEVFEMTRGQNEMRHVRTVSSPAVFAENRPAALGGGAFVVSNDHGVKVGWKRELEMFVGGGNVAYCSPTGTCHTATSKDRMKFPNGLARGIDGLIYVPSSADGTVKVFSLQQDNTLKIEDTIRTGIPLNNISPDARGELYVAAFPAALKTFKSLASPYGDTASPATILRISTSTVIIFDDEIIHYVVDKIIEDKEGKIINGATTVRHDAATGRLFIGAAVHPFLVVCDPTEDNWLVQVYREHGIMTKV